MTKVIINTKDGREYLTLLFKNAAKAAQIICRAHLVDGFSAHLGTYEPGDSKRFPIMR